MPYAETRNGRLHYLLEGDVGKPVLTLSNSLGTNLQMWAPQMPQWLTSFRVLRYDTRGHGDSALTPGPYSIAQLGQDVVDLLDQLSIPKTHFCGVSMGGITGMWLALNAASRLERLVLSNTAAYIGPSDAWTSRAQKVQKEGLAAISSAVVARWLTPDYAQAYPGQLAALTSLLETTSAEGYAANCIAVRDADFRTQISGIDTPTLVISGSGDIPTPPSDGRFLAQQIPHARYVELDGAHLTNQQAGAVYADTVSSFLNDLKG